MKKELLAPAGDIEAGYAALYYGADAVYLGLRQFSARATAANFDEAQLGEFAAYAHHLGRKVYVAVNTLAQENEMPDLLKTLDICVRTGADAVIVQDLGVAKIVRDLYPELEMHASTQMAVHNREGALALQKLGFKRVVTARELSLPEIEQIASIPGLDTEVFIHGALCYSYSGLCLFSSLTTGKSANRGKCLYPCRAEFCDENGRKKHFFSMKDLALREDALRLPVLSLKIEGRKKNALYVAAVTDYYRRLLDGEKDDAVRAENIQQIFSRPWCKFHLNSRDKNVIDRDFVGHRGLLIGKVKSYGKGRLVLRSNHTIEKHDGVQIDVPGCEKPFGFSVRELRVSGKNVLTAKTGDIVEVVLPPFAPELHPGLNVYLASASRVKGAYPYAKPKPHAYRSLQGIDVEVRFTQGRIIAKSGSFQAEIDGNLDPAKDAGKVEAAVQQAFGKTGDTCFCLNRLVIENPDGLFAPVSLLNELRRRLYAAIQPEVPVRYLPPRLRNVHRKNPQWIVKVDCPKILQGLDLHDVAEIILMLTPQSDCHEWEGLPQEKIRLSLPPLCRQVNAFRKKIDALLAQGYRKWEIGNYWGREVLPEKDVDVSADYEIYMLNTSAADMAAEMGISRVTLSPEDTFENWQNLSASCSLPLVLPVYEDIALFTSAVCLRDNACKICDKKRKVIHLTRGSDKFAAISENCQTTVLDERAWYIGAQRKLPPADFYRAAFVFRDYTAEDVAALLNKIRAGCELGNTNCGNFIRRI